MTMEIKQWFYHRRSEQMATALTKAGYTVFQVDSLNEAKLKLLELIPEGASVTVGGSATLEAMDFVTELRTPKYHFFDRYQNVPTSERVEIMRQGMMADYLVTGCNAITKQGELVNRDCTGNRVSGMIFGPRNVILVAGVNKFVNNLDEAFRRITEIAAPLNAKRLAHRTGCVETAFCNDCNLSGRLCNYTTIIHNARKFPGRMTMILVADEVGF